MSVQTWLSAGLVALDIGMAMLASRLVTTTLDCCLPGNEAMEARTINKALLQTPEEWDTRNTSLTSSVGELLQTYVASGSGRGLDIGCQRGSLTDRFAAATDGKSWWGVDPAFDGQALSAGGAQLAYGRADELPFPDGHFSCAVFANVYEHIVPDRRAASLQEIYRVLEPGGIVVGQIPNPYFPIESHSRLPFMGWLPFNLQLRYWKLSPVKWEHDFFVVTLKHVVRDARSAGFTIELTRNFNYPPEVIPQKARRAAIVMRGIMERVRWASWAWQFVLRKPS